MHHKINWWLKIGDFPGCDQWLEVCKLKIVLIFFSPSATTLTGWVKSTLLGVGVLPEKSCVQLFSVLLRCLKIETYKKPFKGKVYFQFIQAATLNKNDLQQIKWSWKYCSKYAPSYPFETNFTMGDARYGNVGSLGNFTIKVRLLLAGSNADVTNPINHFKY